MYPIMVHTHMVTPIQIRLTSRALKTGMRIGIIININAHGSIKKVKINTVIFRMIMNINAVMPLSTIILASICGNPLLDMTCVNRVTVPIRM